MVMLVLSTGVILKEILHFPVPSYAKVFAVILGALVGSLTSTFYVVNDRRMVIESQLIAAVEEQELSVSRLRHEAWTGLRRASCILHGALQSALHAAILRLSVHPTPDEAPITEIRRDIVRA